MRDSPFVLRFKEIDPEETELVGLKGAGLGKMVTSGLPVPNGFVVTSLAYRQFFKRTGLILRIKTILEDFDFRDPRSLGDNSQKIKKLISLTKVPGEIAEEMMREYLRLGRFLKEALVTARSSPINEGLKTASYLNIKGEANLVEAVKKCWASLFEPENLLKKKNLLSEKIAVLVQQMIQSRVSGVVFSTDPGNKMAIIIRAIYGLGELAVKGKVVPDEYRVHKQTLEILKKEINPQPVRLIKVGTSNKETIVPKEKQNLQKLTDQEIFNLAQLAKEIQGEYFFPQEIEFAIEKRKIYILQTQPIADEKIQFQRKLPRKVKEKIKPLKTATKIYLQLNHPQTGKEIGKKSADGVLFQPEFLVTQIGLHPKKLIHEKKEKVFIEKLTEGVEGICQAFYPKPVVYKALDFTTDEYRSLVGGQSYEPKEANPLLGFHGGTRFIADAKIFQLQLEAIKKIRRRGLKNLSLMVPFIRTPSELKEIKKIVTSQGLTRSPSFNLWLMLEVPANIFLEDFIKTGIDGVCMKLPRLLSLILALDEENSEVAPNLAEVDFLIEEIFTRISKACKKHKLLSLISCEEKFFSSGWLELLVKSGMNGVVLSPAAIERTKELVYEIEKRLVRRWPR